MTPGYQDMMAKGTFGEATGYQRTKAEEEAAERFGQTRDWCKRHVPEQHPDIAASSTLTLRLHGRWPAPEQVRARLRAQGRDAETLHADGLDW